jgi:hypothetical protein
MSDPQHHPNCRAHGDDPCGDCKCEVWWTVEAKDCELIGAAACSLCGDVACGGGSACPENDITQVRASRDRCRQRAGELASRLRSIRVRLLDHLGKPRSKGGRPTVEELLDEVFRGD